MSKTENFEEKIKQLEKIIDEMESGELPLHQSMSLYEKGMKLSKDCEKILKSAQLKMEKIADETANDEIRK